MEHSAIELRVKFHEQKVFTILTNYTIYRAKSIKYHYDSYLLFLLQIQYDIIQLTVKFFPDI